MEEKAIKLFSLIRAALQGQKESVDLALEECKSLFECAKQHQILVLFFQGLTLCEIPHSLYESLERYLFLVVAHDQNQRLALEELTSAFEKEGIDYALLKGARLKSLYPKSEYRMLGDLDILLRPEQYRAAFSVMERLGYLGGEETDHEFRWFRKPYISVELHKRLVPTYHEDYDAYYHASWERMKRLSEDSVEWAMSPEDEWIYLLVHLAKHYREGGIGLRHFLDLAVYRKAYPQLDEGYLVAELTKLNLNVFHQNVMAALACWLEGAAETEAVARITKTVLEGGKMGSRENRDQAQIARRDQQSSSVGETRFRYIRDLIFLPLPFMKKKYKAVERHPVLLPLFWVVRWCEILFKEPFKIGRAANRVRRVNRKSIDLYQEELQAVGLEFFGSVTQKSES